MAVSRESRQKIFTRRSSLIFGGQLLLFGTLAGRLTYLQLLQSDRYKTLADENRIRSRLVAPERGRIYDRNLLELARNDHNYRILLIPEETDDVQDTLRKISKIIDLPPVRQKKVLETVRRSPVFKPIEIRDHLQWVEVSKIEVERLNLPGVFISAGQQRIYPQGNLYAHTIGFVALPNPEEAAQNRLFSLPGFHIGKSGVEKYYEENLRGKGGTIHVEVNASGRPLKEVRRIASSSGGNITLSIDNRLQDYVTSRLASYQSASAVLMDVHSGEILAMTSFPNFDPNKFVRGVDPREWKNLLNNPYKPLINKAVSGLYAPASTFKPVVALAALESGISPRQMHYCPGYIRYGERNFYCWASWGHKEVRLTKALRDSCDIWFYLTGLELGVDRMAEYANMFGLGVESPFDLTNVKHGVIPTMRWKQKNIGTGWQNGETLITAIGQGYATATPLQLAVMMSRLVNGGYAVTPRMVMLDDKQRERLDSGTPLFDKIPIADKHLAIVQNALLQVVNHKQGTAYDARVGNERWAFGGKTGTAQVRNISEQERTDGIILNHELPWEKRDHALFIGYAPLKAPRWAISIVIEHGGAGGTVAAPIARDILVNTQRLFR